MFKKFFGGGAAAAMAKKMGPEVKLPFGEDFGLAIVPDYLTDTDKDGIRRAYQNIIERSVDRVVASDGRMQMPPLPPNSFLPLIERMEADDLVPPGHLNNQTANYYEAGDFIRAHVDNLFVYDDIFAIVSLGANALMKFVHIQNGEELEVIIPEDSVYIMSGPARYVYFHMVLPVETTRQSVVFRRSILNSDGSFRPAAPQLKSLSQMQQNMILGGLYQKNVGGLRVSVDDDWMDRENVGTFDTASWVKSVRPLRDWSLRSQLEEDTHLVRGMYQKRQIRADLEWRCDELRPYFKAMEESMIVKDPPTAAAP